ncbi:hypothetical protein DRP53_04710 [candidate division WOR-3 bacterium]|uniref:HEAT repeat domain-containing protein n=1 Tax=candidate division WOR-3 bacterium TaxID=2052148 RepID=A0A660SKA1_UNCW3|nr:MAG: hypothetical protein DRP53_04710 [candidate division WOR-3 bacterium]
MRRRDYRSLLLKWFHSNSIERREEAFQKLSLLPERDRIDLLFSLLEDPSWYLRERAAQRIATYGERVIDRLMDLLKGGVWFTRAAAALALGELGLERSLPVLTELLKKDRNRTVIKEVTRAIGRILIKNHRDLSYLDQFEIREEFVRRLNEYGRDLRAGLGLRSD